MSCLAPYDGNEVFIQRNYNHNGWTNYLHNHAPRFGYTTNVIDWYQGTEAQQSSYAKGLESNVIALSVLFILWIGALIFFRIRGPAYFGWLSGRQVVIPVEPTPDGVPENEDEMLLSEQDKELMTIESIKTNEKLGLSLGNTREGAIVVYNIDEKGLFYGTDLQVGHRIVAVNDQRCMGGLKETIQMLQECEGPFNIKVPNQVCEEDLAVIEWDAVLEKTHRQQRTSRHIIFVALVVIISMGIVLATDGVQALSRALDQGIKTFDKVEEYSQYGLELLDTMETSITDIKKDGRFLLDAINEFCPKQADKICSDVTDPNSCREDLGLPFIGEIKQAISYINYEAGFQQKITEARDELEFLVSHTFGLSDDLEKMHGLLWAIMVMSIALSTICVVIVAGLGFGVPQITGFFRRSCVYPLFIIMVLFSFVLGVSFLMMSLVAADTCHEDPGPKIAAMVRSSYPGGSSEMMNDIMLRIFEGCQAPALPLKENVDRLRDDILFFDRFSSRLEEFEEHRVKHCGVSSWTFSQLDLAINNKVNEHLCTASEDLVQFGDFYTCRFWYPMYFKAVHESMCTDGTDGLAVIATTQIIVVFMALILMTCRAALFDIKISTTTKPNDNMKKAVAEKKVEPPSSSGTLLTTTSRLTDESGSSDGEDGRPTTPIIIAIDDIEPQSQEAQPSVMPAVDAPEDEVRSVKTAEEPAEDNPLLAPREVVPPENVSQRSIMVGEYSKEAPCTTTTPMIGITVLESVELDQDGNSSVSSIDAPIYRPTCQRQTSAVSELSDPSVDNDDDSITWKDLAKPPHLVTKDRMTSIDEEAVVSDTDIQFNPATENDDDSVDVISLDGSTASLHSLRSVETKNSAPFSGISNISTRSLLSYGDVEKRKRTKMEKSDSRRSISSAPCILETKSNGEEDEECNESVTPILVEVKPGSPRRGSSVTLLLPENNDEDDARTWASVGAASCPEQRVTKRLSSATMSVALSEGGATKDIEAGILLPQALRAPQPPVDMDDYDDVAQHKTRGPVDMDDDCESQPQHDAPPQPLYIDMMPDAPREEVASAISPSQILALERSSPPPREEVASAISPSQILALENRSRPKPARRSQSDQPFDEIPMTQAFTSVYSIDAHIADTEAILKERKGRRKRLFRGGSSSNMSAQSAPLPRPGAMIQKQASVTLSDSGAGDVEIQNFV